MIIKVGGSVADKLETVIEALKKANKALIVPGGWIFADRIRELDGEFGLNADNAHWMAVAAMNIYGYFISNFGVETVEPERFEEIKFEGVKVLLPYRLLRNYDELPHSWDVTSDAISVWIATKLGCDMVVKVTNIGGVIVDGKIVSKINASELQQETCVDVYTPKLLKTFSLSMFVCSPEELKKYILKGRAKGTLIEGR